MNDKRSAKTAMTTIDKSSATCRIERYDQGAEIAWITITHKGKMNSIGSGMIADLSDIFMELHDVDELRVAVISGEGRRAFSGGAFVPELSQLTPETGREFITRLHKVCQAIRDCPVPVVGSLQGYCLGAGVELAASCDFRVADRSLVFGMPEVAVGLPSVIEAALLPMLIGWGKAREMMLTSANYSADEGHTMGFVDTLVDIGELDDAVGLRVSQIVAAGPLAVRAQKKLITAWESLNPAEGIALGIDYLAAAYETDEPRRMMAPLLAKKLSKN